MHEILKNECLHYMTSTYVKHIIMAFSIQIVLMLECRTLKALFDV